MSGGSEDKQETAEVSERNGVKEEVNIQGALFVAGIACILSVT